jgi:hypothetical protein
MTASTIPAVMPKNQCNWKRTFLNTQTTMESVRRAGRSDYDKKH